MIHKIKQMWKAFLSGIKLAYKALKGEKIDPDIQSYKDIAHINWIAMAITKISNLCCDESTFEIKSDSKLSQPLINLCNDIENKRYQIVGGMLADGDYYIFPSTNSKGEIYHSFLTSDYVKIVDIDGDEIKSAYAVIDTYCPDDSTAYFLLRKHLLENNGDLTVSYQVVNQDGKPTLIDHWQDIKDNVTIFKNANHIGFGRYKSPISSRGLSPIYGVPLNFGCSEIEKQINEAWKDFNYEIRNGRSVIMTDPRNLMLKSDTKEYVIAENVLPVKQQSGPTQGNNIDIYNPTLRINDFILANEALFATYEKQIGTSKGIFTDNQAMATATATAVKRANADTIALINSIHNALNAGNEMTLKADSVYLNIRNDLWEYESDFLDPFADLTEQWKMLKEANEAGAVSIERLTKWHFPTMTDEEIQTELEKVQKNRQATGGSAIESALLM